MVWGLLGGTSSTQAVRPNTSSRATAAPKVSGPVARGSRHCDQPLRAGSAPLAARQHGQNVAVRAVAVDQETKQELVS